MSLRYETSCDFGSCPYESESSGSCEYWCGAEEPQDYPEAWECGVDDCPESEDGFWIRSTEEIEPASANEVLGWEVEESQ